MGGVSSKQTTPIWPYTLKAGHSQNPADGACTMAAISWLVEGKHDDHPECVDAGLGAFIRPVNDAMHWRQRQKFLPYLHRLAGSKPPDDFYLKGADGRVIDVADERAHILVHAAARRFMPLAFDLFNKPEPAAELRAASPDSQLLTSLLRHIRLEIHPELPRVDYILNRAMLALGDAPFWQPRPAEAAAVATELAHLIRELKPARRLEQQLWQECFAALDACLAIGPQGEAWSADYVQAGSRRYLQAAAGHVKPTQPNWLDEIMAEANGLDIDPAAAEQDIELVS